MYRIIVILVVGWLTLSLSANESGNEKIMNTPALWKVYTDALRGDKDAQFQVGVMYERGVGIDMNQSQAAKWYEKAALQGHMDGQYNIGIMYGSGRGVEQNDRFAMMWLASAAKQGDKEARKVLNALIDGQLDSKKESPHPKIKGSGEVIGIKPIRFEAKAGAMICSMAAEKGKCQKLDKKQIYTTQSKQGNSYKISGMATAHGWESYVGDGWIEMSMVELK